jgi:CBS domain-containing protein
MKVQQLMTGTPAFCRPDTNLGQAVEQMWDVNCGFLPVVDADGCVAGVITDRDICIALGTRQKLAGEITISEVVYGRAFVCYAGDDVRAALSTMARFRVRRLPVLDDSGKLVGVLSMDDVVSHVEADARAVDAAFSSEEIINILTNVYRPNLPMLIH